MKGGIFSSILGINEFAVLYKFQIMFGVFHKVICLRSYSPFCVTAKVIKLVGLKNGGRLSPTNLITFAGTQNGE
jgi:hypothetical protein